MGADPVCLQETHRSFSRNWKQRNWSTSKSHHRALLMTNTSCLSSNLLEHQLGREQRASAPSAWRTAVSTTRQRIGTLTIGPSRRLLRWKTKQLKLSSKKSSTNLESPNKSSA